MQAALLHNPRVLAAKKEALAARLGIRSARALANPEFLVSPALGAINGTTEELLLTQPLEINGARAARTKQATAQAQGVSAHATAEVREVVALVRTAYVQLWRERQLLSVAKDSLENATTLDRIAQKQVELGSRPGIDLAQTGLEVARAGQQVTLAEGRVKSAEAALSTLLGLKPDAMVSVLELPRTKIELASLELATTQALAARTEITIEAATLESLRQDGALARAEGKPDIAPQLRAQQLVTRRATSKDYGFSVAIRLPLIDWGNRKSRIQQSEAAALAQSDRIEAARQQVRQEVAQAYARQSAAQSVLTSFGPALEQARKLLAASKVGFEEGKTALLSVLEAQRSYRATLADYAQAQADASLAQIEIERATAAFPVTLGETKL
ncbi:TolC family protein [Armatimonas sp.]|uniref:TolC family protein n=1 Tax=Armatimonas sp. TaxID=1872638 RepID=UPI003751CB69